MKTKTTLLLLICAFLIISSLSEAQVRKEIKIPDIPGFFTLKCDFHMHTVFSDGSVWPTLRPQEAWQEGLDAISITDHIEYQPYKDDLPTNHNRSYEIALPEAKKYGITLIRGSEITRDMPPGHINAIFLKDSPPLETEIWQDAVKAAASQGAFLFWNHPGWRQPGEVPIWYDEHTEMFEKGWVKGMEIVNEYSYYPLAHKWCLEKGITMIGNSDVHSPTSMDYDFHKGEHRAMTLVFAREKTAESIHEALLEGRTAVYHKDLLIAKEEYLKPILNNILKVTEEKITLTEYETVYLNLTNCSDIPLKLSAAGKLEEITFPETIDIPANSTVLLKIRNQSKDLGEKKVSLPYRVNNFLVEPEKGLLIGIDLNLLLVK